MSKEQRIEEDKKIIETVRAIVDRGNNAEVKKNKDGSLKVFEVKKKIAVG